MAIERVWMGWTEDPDNPLAQELRNKEEILSGNGQGGYKFDRGSEHPIGRKAGWTIGILRRV